MLSPLSASGLVSSLLWTAAHASTNMLYVSSYSGKVTTLEFSSCPSSAAAGVPELKAVSSTDGCAGSPSWLTLDQGRSTLFCVDEDLQSGGGSLSSFRTSANGSLARLAQVKTPPGPVSAALYGPRNSGLAVAH